MYAQVLFLGLATLVAVFGINTWRSLRSNIADAKRSGFPFVVVPVYFVAPAWLLAQVFLLPPLRRLPKSWTDFWLPISLPQEVWQHGYSPFARMQSDTFLAVSPWRNVLWSCDPEAILQFERRRNDFLKPTEMMAILNIFGPTLTASEGEQARIYKKIALTSFNEATMRKSWMIALNETSALRSRWIAPDAKSGLVHHVNRDVARLALHILSAAMYGRVMDWHDSDGHTGRVSAGHELSFEEAIAQVLENTPTIFLTPRFLLKNSPLRAHKKAYQTFREWSKYVEELRSEKMDDIRTNGLSSEPNLLDAIVAAGVDPRERGEDDRDNPYITEDAVRGNMFIFFLGGHETTANTLTFMTVMLACMPNSQRKLQNSLNEILGDRPQSEWSYAHDFPKLLSGYPGFFMNEILRLFTILPFIPKGTQAGPQVVSIKGTAYTVPPQTTILMNTSATHRNPNYWPKPSAELAPGEDAPFPFSMFNPDMWENLSPVPGSYVPFSEGFRSCIGQRFAKVELLAVLAVMFKDFSIELDVASKQEWEKAREHAAMAISRGVDLQMSLKMVPPVPMRLVRCGEELSL